MDKLKFSQLLLLGSKRVKHCVRSLYNTNHETKQIDSACAVGMIIIAMAGTTDDATCREMYKVWSKRSQEESPGINLESIIVDWNDNRCMSPDQIATELEKKGL